MSKREIYWNEKLNDYTFEKEIDGVKSVKKVPIKFKPEDRTAKYRKDILKKDLDEN